MPTQVTEVMCHSISGLKQSYNYMCSGTYYLIIRALALPALNSLRLGGEVQYNFSFTLPYKHVWTLSYIYRVLISPIDESSEQRNNKTKPKHSIFHAVNSSFATANPRPGQPSLSASLQHGDPSPLGGVSSLLRRTLAITQIFLFWSIFPEIQPKTKENSYII